MNIRTKTLIEFSTRLFLLLCAGVVSADQWVSAWKGSAQAIVLIALTALVGIRNIISLEKHWDDLWR